MPTFKTLLKNPAWLLAFGFGSGLAKQAPGTWGTLAAIPLYGLLVMLSPSVWVYGVITVLLFVVGVWVCDYTEKSLGLHDPGNIVWDEMVGYLVTMIYLPVDWVWMLAGFVLFRFFDILKPWPIRWFDQHCTGGFGVMVDDVVAGMIACGCLHVVYYFQ